MKELSREDSITILKKMCHMIGVSYEAVSFIQPNWFDLHTWTPEEEKQFIGWLADFLVKKKYTTKKRALREARKLNMQYGWKTV